MKNKFYVLVGTYLFSSLVCAHVAATTPAKPVNGPDPHSYFEIKRKATEVHVNSLQALSSVIEQFVTERQVETINSRLYNVGSKGEPAPGEPDLELYDTHIKMFCSPLSGYEGKIFPECNKTNPLLLQHADLKPIVLLNTKFGHEMIPIVRNWIDNFLTPLTYSNMPDYIKESTLMANTENRERYVHRLRDQIPMSTAANSLNVMLARRIPVDPKTPESPSVASSLVEEVNGRHLNSAWHTAIQSAEPVDLAKEQLRVLALISYQMQELTERMERVELLNAALVTSIANQHDTISEILHYTKLGGK